MRCYFGADILRQSLNDVISYSEFFEALGYGRKDKVYLRFFHEHDKDAKAYIREPKLYTLPGYVEEFRAINKTDRGVFFVVNGGGRHDRDVKEAKALFVDFDDFPFEEQIRRLNEFPLEPSIVIKTRKSLHAYWILDDSDRNIFRWNELQCRLINYFGSDPSIENPSRVMRLYGFEHRKKEPVMVTLIKFDPELRYPMSCFHSVLPRKMTERQRKKLLERMNGGGDAEQYSKQTITGMKEIALPEGLIRSARTIKRDQRLRWLQRWARNADLECSAVAVLCDGSVLYDICCPWSDEHTTGDVGTPAGIIVYPSGKIGFHCFHGHCADRGWKELRQLFDQADQGGEAADHGD